MGKKLTITNAHSQNNPTQRIEIELSGGSPWFGAIWINDVLFVIYVDGITGKISLKKQR